MSFFGNIPSRRAPAFEQSCERYGTMAFEVFWRSLAYNFKSIKYSYEDGTQEGEGIFTAVYVPFPEPVSWAGHDSHPRVVTTIRFKVILHPKGDNSSWTFSDGVITIENQKGVEDDHTCGHYNIRFAYVNEGGTHIEMVVECPDKRPSLQKRHRIGNGHRSRDLGWDNGKAVWAAAESEIWIG